jgi:predicted phosphodiesterase
MRYGVIADVHANAHALDAALEFLRSEHVERYLCAGDLVGYGPAPNECVRRVLALPGLCVAGNHDLIALGRLGDERCIARARASLRWTRGVLEKDVWGLLAALPLGAEADGIALRHGSLADPQVYVVTDEQARAVLEDLQRTLPATQLLVLGHTHRPMAFSRRRGRLLRSGTGQIDLSDDDPILLNPGAVGQSRSADVRARVMVLDTAAHIASFHAIAYDVEGCRQALLERGLPADSYHLPRSRRPDLAAGVRRVLRSICQR